MAKFEARKLKWSDTYKLSAIVKKLRLRRSLEDLDLQNKDAREVGMQAMLNLGLTALENLGEAEKEVNAFLAGVAGVEVSDIENASYADITALAKQIVENEGLTAFLDSLAALNTETSTTS